MYAGVSRVRVVNVYPAVEPGMRSCSDTAWNCAMSMLIVERRGMHCEGSSKGKWRAHIGHVIQPRRGIDAISSEFSVSMSEEKFCDCSSSIGL
jgi:hypothetical protein